MFVTPSYTTVTTGLHVSKPQALPPPLPPANPAPWKSPLNLV
jgi:hypothetical protein